MIYLSNEQKKQKSDAFCIRYKRRTDVIIPDVARYVLSGDRNPRHKMFHDEANMSECTRIDHSGICMGHEMSLKDFINKYCGGIMPDSM